MTQRIEIEGQVARVIEETIVAETSLAALMPHLETRLPSYLPLLPDHTRVVAFNPDTKRGALLVELPPARRHLRVRIERGDRVPPIDRDRTAQGLAVWHVQMPFQYFFYAFTLRDTTTRIAGTQDFTLDNGLYLWRKEAIRSLNDPVWTGRIWNVDNNARICWGYTRHETASLALRVDDMVKSFPHTIFNLHLGYPRPNELASMLAWEQESENPLAYREWSDWNGTPLYRSINELFERAMREEGLPTPTPLENGTDAIPLPPETFTVARALEWMDGLPEQRRNRFLHALQRWTTTHPDEEPDDQNTAEPGRPAPDDAPAPAEPAAASPAG